MSDLLYGRGLNILLGLLFVSMIYAYVRAMRHFRDEAIVVRIAVAGIALPTMAALVLFQIYLFRMVTSVSRPLEDIVCFATMCGEGLAAIVIILRASRTLAATGGER
jgi:hypothetical protein